MKRIIPLIIAFIFASCNEKPKNNESAIETTNYSNLLEKPISNEKVDGFLKKLGSDYEYDNSYERKFYEYKNQGVELNFSETDTLKAIFFKVADLNPDIKLPLNITATDTRMDIEKKFGKPDKYFVGLNNLNSYYLKNNLVVKYKSKDTTNMNNGLQNVSIQKLDRKKILGTE